MDNILETVDRCDLALTPLVGATNNGNLVVLSDWDGADLDLMSEMLGVCAVAETNVVLLAELLAKRCAHDSTSNAGWSIVMSLAGLSP